MDKKKIVHIFDGKDKHLNPNIIKGILDNKEERHLHVILISMMDSNSKKLDKTLYDWIKEEGFEVLFVSSWLKLYTSIIRDSPLVIFHGYVSPVRKNLLLLVFIYFFNRKKLKNFVLVSWGSRDFYINKFWFHFVYPLFKQFGHIVTLTKADFDFCKSYYKENCVQINYIIPQGYRKENKNKKVFSKNNKVRVLISHSGWQQNNHEKSFALIQKIKEENIEVICPLAYGDSGYINYVIQKGKDVFGEKFYYFKDLMPVDDYYDFLQTIDIYVTSADVQTGLFALTACLGSGAKVFCGENLYYSMKFAGYSLYSVNDLVKMNVDEIISPNHRLRLVNESVYKKQFVDIESLKSKWDSLYDS